MNKMLKSKSKGLELSCKCGNKSYLEGFYPWDEKGRELDSIYVSSWKGLYICGEIVDIRGV